MKDMKYIRVSITSACNMRCVYCHNEGNTTASALTTEDVLKFAKAAKEMGYTQFRITGGDPLCHPNFEEICTKLHEMGITVGVNTNASFPERIVPLIEKGIVEHITVGIDYFDSVVSKMSPIGPSSRQILGNIIKLRDAGCKHITVDCVYSNSYSNAVKMFDWCLKHKILLKIIEPSEKQLNMANHEFYNKMVSDLSKSFNITLKTDPAFGDFHGYIGDELVIKFYRSCCVEKECDKCYLMHLRLSSDYKLKYCLYESKEDIDCRLGDLKENLKKALTRKPKKIVLN